jgi:hypothetical protein
MESNKSTMNKGKALSPAESLVKKKEEYAGIVRLMQLHTPTNKLIPAKQSMEIQNEQFRLERRLLELEELGFDAKIEAGRKVLHHLQSIK